MKLNPDAVYYWYVDYAAIRAGNVKQSTGIIVGPFNGDHHEWLIAVSMPYRNQYDRSAVSSINRYQTTLVKHNVLYSLHDGEETQQYAPSRCHVLTPTEALPILSDMARIRELFATEPAAAVVAQRAPETLWDLLDDDDSATDEEEDE